MIKILVALIVLGLNSYVYWSLASEEVIPPRSQFAEFPDQSGDWRCLERETLEDDVLETLMVSDYLSCVFYNDARREAVHVYVGYHERQTRDRTTGKATAIHPPEHCLPGGGWNVIDSKVVPNAAADGGEAKRFIVAKGNLRSLVYFWYHSRGRVIARSHQKILYMFLDRATTGRTDGSLVRFTIPIENGDIEKAEAMFAELSEEIVPRLGAHVPD